MDWIYPLILVGAGLVVVSIYTSVVAFRFGAPLLLVFLAIGLLAGEDGLGLTFDDPNSAYLLGSLALAVILFDSGFSTRARTLRQAAAPAFVLATLGVVLTTLLVGVAAHVVLGLPWAYALLMGAIISSTDAAAVFFLLRVGGITINERVRSMLEVESGSNDPMAIFLTLFFIELILSGAGTDRIAGTFLQGFGIQMGLGLALGLLGGYLIAELLNRVTLEDALYPIAAIGLALCLFAVVGELGGSGFLAVYVAGIIAGNRPMRAARMVRRYQEGMTWLAQIIMFLTLGLLATPSEFLAVAPQAIALALFLTFIARPLAIGLCLLPFRFDPRTVAFISWVGLRGAVSILLAILPLIAGLDHAGIFFNTAFIIVLTSLLVQGWTIRPTARSLQLIVRPDIGPVERVELELPGDPRHELAVYRVIDGSPVMRGARLPRWARPSLVVRDGRSMRYQQAGKLAPGDYVYIFVSPNHFRLLDRLFASPQVLKPDDKEFFGEFNILPDKPLALLEVAYGIALDTAHPERPIGDYLRQELGGLPIVGDRIALGSVELIVREVDDQDNIRGVGLAFTQRRTSANAGTRPFWKRWLPPPWRR